MATMTGRVCKFEHAWLSDRFLETKRQLSARFKTIQERKDSSDSKSPEDSSLPKGCEVFVGRLPRYIFEDELVPLFQSAGELRQFRLTRADSSGTSRGCAIATYVSEEDAKLAIDRLDGHAIRPRRRIAVFKSENDFKLHIDGMSNKQTNARKEKTKAIEEAILLGKEDSFEVQEFGAKGRGVVPTKAFARGEFVVEYHGELIDYAEAVRREAAYVKLGEEAGCFMYFFKFSGKRFCIDATKETGRLGRLINHGRKGGNLKAQSLLVHGAPRLALFASRDIEPGEELLYDYGDRRKQVLESNPWLAQ